MASGQDENLRSFYIPRNVKRDKKIFQIRLKNLIEAAVLGSLLVLIIMGIDSITQDAKLIISIVVCMLLLVFEARGWHDCTILGYAFKAVRYIWTRKEYDYKPLEEIYNEQKKNPSGDTGTETYKSPLARVVGKFKKTKA